MELPHIGKHCTVKTCNQIDFLPFNCQYCRGIFCAGHWKLSQHDCPKRELAEREDYRVPVCPLCNEVISVPRGEVPDIKVDQHIANGCRVAPKKPSNVCSLVGCSEKILVPIYCKSCKRLYCVKHRLEADHKCGPNGRISPALNKPETRPSGQSGARAAASRAGAAALVRLQGQSKPMSEKERQEKADRELAAALQRSFDEADGRQGRGNPRQRTEKEKDSSCSIS